VGTTESCFTTETKLERIAWLSSMDHEKVFQSLMHLYNRESLEACFRELDGRKAVGIDGVDKAEYGVKLAENLEGLLERMKKMSYRPGSVREVLIPKDGKLGNVRPLGIGNFEDKVVQKMTQKILEAVYDPLFHDCSYGFRPGRGCHDAIGDLSKYLYNNEVEVVIDVDLSRFFDTINHDLLIQLLRRKTQDESFVRYIVRMFKAGVLSQGELSIGDEGIPQGSPCSPVLANIFAHFVIDEWFEGTVKARCSGGVRLFRYADDVVICCGDRRDAERVLKALKGRLEKHDLGLNEEKTKMVSFSKKGLANGERQGTFDFLGFTFYLGKSRKGHVIPKIKTVGKRLRGKLKAMDDWCKMIRNRLELNQIWLRFCAKLEGHIRYFGVSHNVRSVSVYIFQSCRLLYKWLNRRSQRKSFNWETFSSFLKLKGLPRARICHRLF
jgi:RNA-directed DNA polymerase